MKLTVILLALLFAFNISGQTKYFIYFNDKGNSLTKDNFESKSVIGFLSDKITDKAIERRTIRNPEADIIGFEDLPVYEPYLQQLENHGIKPVRVLNWFNAVSAYLTDDQINEVLSFPFVKKTEKVKQLAIIRSADVANDLTNRSISKKNQNFIYDYGLSEAQYIFSDIPAVHTMGFNATGVLIGVLDSGFDWEDHDAFGTSNIIAEYDFVQNDEFTGNEPGDVAGQSDHGTYVFSLLGGYEEGEIVAPAFGASFLLAKTENIASETNVEEDNYAAALEWMENQGVDIVTSSLGYSTFDNGEHSYSYEDMDGNTTIVTKALKVAFSKGVVTITSAGNEGNSAWKYITAPADEDNVIAVGAVNLENKIASFSSVGPTYDGRIKPELTTNGVDVYGARAGSNLYKYSSGTSSAAPIAAGIAGQLLGAYPYLTNKQVRKILLESCDHSAEPDNISGYGRLSALKAITFPNIYVENDLTYINKMFDPEMINENTAVTIHYSFNGAEFYDYPMSANQQKQYVFNTGILEQGDSASFYYTYNSVTDSEMREPQNGVYKFIAGHNLISYLTGVDNGYETPPSGFYLYNNYPNPFNPETVIKFYTENKMDVDLSVYNSLGEKICTIFRGTSLKGENSFTWNGRNGNGRVVSSGAYYYILKSGDRMEVNNMMLIK